MAILNGRVELQGQVVDVTSMEPLPGATVTVIDHDGTYLGDGVAADNDGKFRINSTLFPGNLLAFTNVGYQDAAIDPAELSFYTVIGLSRTSDSLPPVVVTPGKKKTPWWLLGGLALLLILKK